MEKPRRLVEFGQTHWPETEEFFMADTEFYDFAYSGLFLL
jgi:hypothetical protein